MPPKALLRLALRGLLLHKLRSSLSILGVVFGVGAVVAMSSVGEGARREALEQVGALGIDTITVRPRTEGGAGGLRVRDADAVASVVPGVAAVAPLRAARLAVGGAREPVEVVGTTPAYQAASRLPVAAGRFLAPLDVADRKRIAVLGSSVAQSLFPLSDPRGQSVLLGEDWFQVVGVLEGRATSRKAGPIRTRDVNRAIFVPQHQLVDAVGTLLRRTSGGTPLELVVPREILRQRERTQRIFNVVTGAIAAISLLVGGIGIMNIMLASVAERTREVGIRRALGATRRDISAQFLAESSLLTTAGGLLGAVLGVMGSFLIQRLAGWPTALSPVSLLMALLMALLVGVGFGLYPAWHAARLEPMDALRSE